MEKGCNYGPGLCRKCGKDHGIHPCLGKPGHHHSEETKKKISDTKKGNKNPMFGHTYGDIPCIKCGKIHTPNRGMLGRRHTEETKIKMSENHKGSLGKHWFHTEEWKRDMSNKLKGRHLSDEQKEQISIVHTGLHPSEETRVRMSEGMKGKNKGKKRTPEQIELFSKVRKEEWENLTPEERMKRGAISKEVQNRPDVKAKKSEKLKKSWINGDFDEANMGARGVGGKRSDLNDQFFRSTWEANLARIMNYHKIKWEYEPKRFDFGEFSYCPDFYLPETDSWVEVYGYLDEDKAKKLWAISKLVNIQIVNETIYDQLKSEFKDKLPFWENGRKKVSNDK